MSYLQTHFSQNCIFKIYKLFFSYLDFVYHNKIWHAVSYDTLKETYKRIFD